MPNNSYLVTDMAFFRIFLKGLQALCVRSVVCFPADIHAPKQAQDIKQQSSQR